jgi:threonine 3-dehydrogenase
MLYMPDCLEATWQLMTAPREALSETTYNVTAMTFTPEQLAAAIRTVLPHFQMRYTPDFRDGIARTWPESIDDSNARRDWGWQHKYDLKVRQGAGRVDGWGMGVCRCRGHAGGDCAW